MSGQPPSSLLTQLETRFRVSRRILLGLHHSLAADMERWATKLEKEGELREDAACGSNSQSSRS
ncbi:hypothetical protein BGW80DRAFT_261872 [Lactifluus volemus]|nr:hypothetical protein BGW80DRAFT_261872 [Lactifluus volemus]